jgi:hypothetical protein
MVFTHCDLHRRRYCSLRFCYYWRGKNTHRLKKLEALWIMNHSKNCIPMQIECDEESFEVREETGTEECLNPWVTYKSEYIVHCFKEVFTKCRMLTRILSSILPTVVHLPSWESTDFSELISWWKYYSALSHSLRTLGQCSTSEWTYLM